MQTLPHLSPVPRGFTLVELLIAMVLGLALMAGVIQIFISTQNTYRMEEGLSKVQDSGRFALMLITEQFKMAGYPYTGGARNSFAWNTGGLDNAGTTSRSPANNDSSDASMRDGTDDLVFQYLADFDTATDCLGGSVGGVTAIPPTLIQNRYFVDNNRTLNCATTTDGGTTLTTQPLVDNVENFQVMYGSDTNQDGVPDSWQSGLPAIWKQVVAVRIALLVSTGGNVADSADSQSFSMLGGEVSVAPANDLQRRRVFTTTIALRNNQPETFCRTPPCMPIY